MSSVSDYLVEHAAEAALWSYALVFLLTFLETSALVGLVVPGETTVILAGALASQGVLRLPYLMAIVAAAAIMGDSVGYILGRRVGRDLVLRHPRLFRVKPGHFRRADRYFARYGGLTILFGRWVGFLRSLAPFLAGSARMSYPRFVAFDVAGCVSWAVVLCAVGYAFGESYKLVEKRLGEVSLFLAILLVGAVLFYFLGRWLWKRKAVLGGVAGTLAEVIIKWRAVTFLGRRLAPEIAWVGRRFSPGQSLGLALTFGLILTALLTWTIVVLVRGVLTRDPVSLFDLQVANLLSKNRLPWLDSAMTAVEWMGSIPVTLGLASVGCGLFSWRRRFRDAVILITSVAGGIALALLLNVLTATIDLDGTGAWDLLQGADQFPSILGAATVALYMTTALLATGWVRLWDTRVYALLLGTGVTLLVGFSRIYLASDTISSLLAGYSVGALWVTVSVTAATVWERARSAALTAESERRAEPALKSDD